MESIDQDIVKSVEELWQRWLMASSPEQQHLFIDLVITSVQHDPMLAAKSFQRYDENGMFIYVQVWPLHLAFVVFGTSFRPSFEASLSIVSTGPPTGTRIA